MFDELGIGEVIDRATHQNPELRDLTVGEAVKAVVLLCCRSCQALFTPFFLPLCFL
jgi:hypothetical protein